MTNIVIDSKGNGTLYSTIIQIPVKGDFLKLDLKDPNVKGPLIVEVLKVEYDLKYGTAKLYTT